MHRQSRSLYEGFATPFLWADVGPVAAVYSFYSIVLAIVAMTTFRCPYHDEQDHFVVQNLYRKSYMQNLSHFHCCFAVNCRSHQDQLRADCCSAAAVAGMHFGRIAPRKMLATMASVAAAERQDCSSGPAPCAAGIVAQRRRQQQQGPFRSTCS